MDEFQSGMRKAEEGKDEIDRLQEWATKAQLPRAGACKTQHTTEDATSNCEQPKGIGIGFTTNGWLVIGRESEVRLLLPGHKTGEEGEGICTSSLKLRDFCCACLLSSCMG
ncbi:hypothetical protein EMCG_02641 [[Emmonsia] crescens]|uniref:Uncharacterized protein n=1 Tax=[Emmonsia] crescens TaxID=73230 RepID=A0A0G2J8W3_9EURO|nr:hypothetical protein EMCG_02641 [Emmonsia crescens UAMH 3008]